MGDRSSDIEYVRAEIQVLREMIDDALDHGAGSDDPQLNELATTLSQRRKLLHELESITLYVSRPSNG